MGDFLRLNAFAHVSSSQYTDDLFGESKPKEVANGSNGVGAVPTLAADDDDDLFGDEGNVECLHAKVPVATQQLRTTDSYFLSLFSRTENGEEQGQGEKSGGQDDKDGQEKEETVHQACCQLGLYFWRRR